MCVCVDRTRVFVHVGAASRWTSVLLIFYLAFQVCLQHQKLEGQKARELADEHGQGLHKLHGTYSNQLDAC